MLRATAGTLTRLFDVTATKDWANRTAAADVVVDGTVLLPQVPVPYLLFLEKQLTDLHTFVRKLPVLDASEAWNLDPSTDAWKTDPVRTIRTKKVPRNHVKAEATEKHPAQVEVYYEDVPVGYWTTVKFSGALSARRATPPMCANGWQTGARELDTLPGSVTFPAPPGSAAGEGRCRRSGARCCGRGR